MSTFLSGIYLLVEMAMTSPRCWCQIFGITSFSLHAGVPKEVCNISYRCKDHIVLLYTFMSCYTCELPIFNSVLLACLMPCTNSWPTIQNRWIVMTNQTTWCNATMRFQCEQQCMRGMDCVRGLSC